MNETRELPTIIPAQDGTPRVLACLAPRADFGGLPKFAAAIRILPRDQWRDVDLSPFLHATWDQGQHGSCVGHGSATAFHLAYRVAGGTVPEGGFSPTSLYALINGGRDRGAIVSDAMTALVQHGLALMSEVPESIIYEGQIPASAKATRKRFRVQDAFHCDSFDAIASALQLGFPVSFGILLPGRFNNLDAQGVCGLGGRSLGGHCMAAYGMKQLPSGKWAVRVRNSWGTRWGIAGNCLLVEEHFSEAYLDAFAIRANLADPQDPNPAPMVILG